MTGQNENYPHSGVDLLAPAGAAVRAPVSGTIEPSGTEAVLICQQNGTICCNGRTVPRLICWRLVHIAPTVTSGRVAERQTVATVLPQNSPIPPHVHVEYYETQCINGNPRVAGGDPTPHLPSTR